MELYYDGVRSKKYDGFYRPIVHSLGEPAQDRVPVGKVGLFLWNISLTVGQHISQVFHKVIGLLFQNLLIKVTQVNQITWQTSNSLKVKQVLSCTRNKSTSSIFQTQFIQNTLPSKQRVWLPSRHTQMSKHCSSRLRNKMNFRSRSCDWIDDIHCCDTAVQYSYYTKKGNNVCFMASRTLTSGVRILRWDVTAGTDMIWRRKDLSRLSEKWAAMTGLKNIRLRSNDHMQIIQSF